ncbi:Uncharacterised protein [Candidatus Norongarragalina meridionalis]|nr:Uncharacterised protein [Candidatus Norongarragalina meridionalis]
MTDNTTNEFKNVAADFRKMQEQFRDPVVIGALLNAVSEERTATNLILKEINAKLERMEARINALETRKTPDDFPIPEVDGDIYDFVKKKGVVCAADVQKKFSYKGKNAASARLNGMFRQGLLEKKQVGKRVFFSAKGDVKK